MQLLSFHSREARSFIQRIKGTPIFVVAIRHYMDNPFLSERVPRYPFVSRSIPSSFAHILRIPKLGRNAKIGYSVVTSIVIYVVNMLIRVVSVNVKPRQPMSEIAETVNVHFDVTHRIRITSSFVSISPCNVSPKETRFRNIKHRGFKLLLGYLVSVFHKSKRPAAGSGNRYWPTREQVLEIFGMNSTSRHHLCN